MEKIGYDIITHDSEFTDIRDTCNMASKSITNRAQRYVYLLANLLENEAIVGTVGDNLNSFFSYVFQRHTHLLTYTKPLVKHVERFPQDMDAADSFFY